MQPHRIISLTALTLCFLLTSGPSRVFGEAPGESANAAAQEEADAKNEVAKVVVPRIRSKNLGEDNVQILTDILLDVLLNRHGIEAMGPMEIADLLSLDAQRELLGCSQTSCLSDIGGSLGARYLIAGSVGKLGSQLFLTLRLIDTEVAKPAGRASIKIAKLEDAADALGPLTDKLLGRTFRAARSSEIAAFRHNDEEAVVYDAMSHRDFLKAFNRYREQIEKGPFSKDLIKQRGTLLRDLLLTSSQPRYDEKYKRVAGAGWVGARARGRVHIAQSQAAAEDARRCFYEWLAFARGVEDVDAAYKMGREKEKLGTGGLPSKLPSGILKAASVPTPDRNDQVKAFLAAYPKAQKTLGRALKSKTEAAFVKRFTKEDPKHSRSSPEYGFKSLQTALKNEYKFDPCPLYLLSADDIEARAKAFAEKQLLKGCYRKLKQGSAYLHGPKLKKIKGQWLIERW